MCTKEIFISFRASIHTHTRGPVPPWLSAGCTHLCRVCARSNGEPWQATTPIHTACIVPLPAPRPRLLGFGHRDFWVTRPWPARALGANWPRAPWSSDTAWPAARPSAAASSRLPRPSCGCTRSPARQAPVAALSEGAESCPSGLNGRITGDQARSLLGICPRREQWNPTQPEKATEPLGTTQTTGRAWKAEILPNSIPWRFRKFLSPQQKTDGWFPGGKGWSWLPRGTEASGVTDC